MMRIVVDLPAPFGPRKPVTRPGRATKDTSSTARWAPYVLVTPSTVIMRLSLVAAARPAHRPQGSRTATKEGGRTRRRDLLHESPARSVSRVQRPSPEQYNPPLTWRAQLWRMAAAVAFSGVLWSLSAPAQWQQARWLFWLDLSLGLVVLWR